MYCLIQGYNQDVLSIFADNSIDSVVCDPPYGLRFMNAHWDYDVPQSDTWREVFRVMKPGAYLLAFFGSRTYHRGVVQIEDAGFAIHPLLGWLFSQGFPKATRVNVPGMDGFRYGLQSLKPALEPICMAQKPFSEATGTRNVERWGTGAINIDRCRIEFTDDKDLESAKWGRGTDILGGNYVGATHSSGKTNIEANPVGRWPANLVHDGSPEVLGCFPDAPGQMADAKFDPGGMKNQNCYGAMKRGNEPSSDREYSDCGGTNFAMKPGTRRMDTGSAARFFYCAKASRFDRNEGLHRFAKRPLYWSSGEQNPGSFQSEGTDKSSANNWPTVKPTTLMRYLCRLVTPPGGLVLDPFAGSGSTGKAAVLEGFDFLGVEMQPLYIAGQRIAWAGYEAAREALANVSAKDPQISLFEEIPS